MKKLRILSLAAFLIAACFVCNSCYGPFRLTTKLYTWNGTVGSKWANEGVFLAFAIIPVYAVTLFLDGIIFNSIEFWGGSNPISMNDDDVEIQIVKSGDKEYSITAMKNKFIIEQLKGPQAGDLAEVLFIPEEQSCYLNHNGEKTKLYEYLPAEDGRDQVNLYLPGGNLVKMDAGSIDPGTIQAIIQEEIHYLAVQQ